MKAKQLFYAAIIGLISQWGMANAQGYRSLRDVDFANYTYRYADQEFHVENGRYESEDETAPMESLEVVSLKLGYLTQTLKEDAVVLTRYNGGGTGFFDALHIFKLENGQPVVIDVLEAGDRAEDGIKTFYIDNGSLYIVSYDGEHNVCRACFDYEYTTEYKWKNHQLVAVGKSEPRKISESEKPTDTDLMEEGEEEEITPAERARGMEGTTAESLLELLNSPQENARSKAIAMLGETKDSQYVDLIVKALKDPSTLVRSAAALALAEIGNEGAVNSLIRALNDESWEVRTDVIWALGELRAHQAIPAIMQAYQRAVAQDCDRSGDEAVEALGKIKAQPAVPVLMTALQSAAPDRRATAARALGEIGDTAAIPVLEAVLKAETRPYIRSDIKRALEKLSLQ